MKKLFVIFTFLAGMCACMAIEDNEEVVPSIDRDWFSVSVEKASQPDTKIYMNENYKIRWNKDDLVSVFNKSSFNRKYRFTGEDGASSGTIEKVGNVFHTGETISYVYAVYPYSASNSIGEDDEILTFSFPEEQYYLENSFGKVANLMVSVSDGDNENLFFKNAGGYLRLKLYGTGVTVSSIVLTGNNSEPLSGEARVTATPEGTPSVQMSQSASQSVTLLCDPAVTLGTDADYYTAFYFVIPPTTFEKGFSITVSGEGGSFVKHSSKTLDIPRNTIVSMVPLEVSFD